MQSHLCMGASRDLSKITHQRALGSALHAIHLLAIGWNEASSADARTCELNNVDVVTEIIGGRIILKDDDLSGSECHGQSPVETLLHIMGKASPSPCIRLPIDDQR